MVTPAYGIATRTRKGKLPRDCPLCRSQLFIGPSHPVFYDRGGRRLIEKKCRLANRPGPCAGLAWDAILSVGVEETR